MTSDVLGLEQFTQHILGGITAMAPVAVVGLVVILVLFGAMRAGR